MADQEEKRPMRKYQLSIRLYEGDSKGEIVVRTVNARDSDDAIAQAGIIDGVTHTDGIVSKLLNERLNFNLKAKVVKCRQVGDVDLQPA